MSETAAEHLPAGDRGLLPEDAPDTPFPAWSAAEVDKAFRALTRSQAETDLRVAWLGNHTLEPLLRRTAVAAATLGIRLDCFSGGFDQHFQDLLDDSSDVLRKEPGAIVLSLSLRGIAPRLVEGGSMLSASETNDEIERVVTTLAEWIGIARQRTAAHLFICNFPRPPSQRLGPADSVIGHGENYIYRELDRRLTEIVGDDPQVSLIDLAHAVARAGLASAWNPKMYRLAKIELDGPPASEAGLSIARACRALIKPARKCLVVDLDNTLWGGVLGEEGPEGVRVSQGDPVGEAFFAFQHALLDLKARGILLAICSKNNPEDVEEAFRLRPDMPLASEDFACRAVNWEPKHTNIRQIARTLNIGTDSLAFVDDNPAECELVRQTMPEVLTIQLPHDPSLYAELIYGIPDFDNLRPTAEDREKTRQYAANFAREEARSSVQDMASFLESLETEVTVRPAARGDLTRVHQLFSKTNQFNTTTIRYSPADVQQFVEAGDCILDVVSARDRFGDLGIIGLYLVRLDTDSAHVDSFVMSCRALGRGIETAACNVLKDKVADRQGVERLTARFVTSAKNRPAADFFPSQGFRVTAEDNPGTVDYALAVAEFAARRLPRHRHTPGRAEIMNADLTTLVADVMGMDEQDVSGSLSREEEERWDSLTHLRLITAVEEAFSIRFTMDEIENIATLADVDELVRNKSDSA